MVTISETIAGLERVYAYALTMMHAGEDENGRTMYSHERRSWEIAASRLQDALYEIKQLKVSRDERCERIAEEKAELARSALKGETDA